MKTTYHTNRGTKRKRAAPLENQSGSAESRPVISLTIKKTQSSRPSTPKITKRGVTAWANANKISFSVAAADREKYGYLRVRAYARDDSGEIIFSQPMMLT